LSREEIAYVGNHAVCKLQPNKKCDTQLLLLKTLSALQQTKHKNQSSSYKRKEKNAKMIQLSHSKAKLKMIASGLWNFLKIDVRRKTP
jgi:hypothetical protein